MRATGWQPHAPAATLVDSSHGPSRAHLHLPELRRRLWPLAGQVRRLRRVEHHRRGGRGAGAGGHGGARARPAMAGGAPRKGRKFALEPLTGETHDAPRLASGLAEFDRVTGGGFVRGSVLLLGGDPGIGTRTLLHEVATALARAGHRAVYISDEEAVAQVRLRAERLKLQDAQIELAAENSVGDN